MYVVGSHHIRLIPSPKKTQLYSPNYHNKDHTATGVRPLLPQVSALERELESEVGPGCKRSAPTSRSKEVIINGLYPTVTELALFQGPYKWVITTVMEPVISTPDLQVVGDSWIVLVDFCFALKKGITTNTRGITLLIIIHMS